MKRRLLFALLLPLLFCLGCVAHAQAVTIAKVGDDLQVHAAKYDAVVASDGSMTSLKIGASEFLNANVAVSRGVYFYGTNGVQKLPRITQNGATISAEGDTATLRYEFSPAAMTWTAINKIAAQMNLFIVLPQAVNAAKNGDDWAAAPMNRQSSDTAFFQERSRLQIAGGSRLWGPWEGNTQVWEAVLAPNETRTIELRIGETSGEESARIAQIARDAAVASGAVAAPETDITVLSPRPYQVVQRQTRTRGNVLFSGRVKPDCDSIQVKISGGKSLAERRVPILASLPILTPQPMEGWSLLPFDASTRSFNSMLQVPAGGWYKVEIRASKKGKVVAQTVVENVGVGEVFLGSGQSNSTNYGEGHLKTQTKMVSTFDGRNWRIADDPQPGVHDQSGGGSFWPAFGDALATKYGVPIGVATTGHGGTSVNQWQPDGELFNWTLMRVHQLGRGGFRAMLWHQGESDVGMTTGDYAGKLTNTIREMQNAAGWNFPWIVAQVSYLNPGQPSFATTRDAQAQLWATGVALQGPDTDLLSTDNRDGGGAGIHFSEKGLNAHGKAWADKVSVYLDKVVK